MLTVEFDHLALGPGSRLLDLGCGFGRHGFEAARRGATVTSVDLADAELRFVRECLANMTEGGEIGPAAIGGTALGDATALPFGEASFDVVVASEVLEHIDDDDAALAELRRVVRPGGTVAVTVPAELPERLCWWLSDDYHAPAVPGGHVRIYSARGLSGAMSARGLRPVRSHRTHALHSPYWWLRCAMGVERGDQALVRGYRRLLEYEIVQRPRSMAVLEQVLAPVMGKSLVVYAEAV